MVVQVLHPPPFNFSVLTNGDTIGVKGNSSIGSTGGLLEYYHLGIYLGGRTQEVIDYTNDSEVRRIRLTVFTENDTRPLYRIRYTNAPPASRSSEIVERAVTQFRYKEFGQYDEITNNCEHFATYCTFGKTFSCQVAKVVRSKTWNWGCVSM